MDVDTLKSLLDGDESIEELMMKMMMFGGMNSSMSSSGMCAEDDWRDHPLSHLFLAASRRDAALVVSLLQHGAEKYRLGVDELDGDGAGVLHNLALYSDLTEGDAETIVQAFKDAGADLDLKGGSMMAGETPLHVAACYGHFAMVKALIDAGAKADICDKFGKTPLDKSTDIKSPDGERTTELIQSAVARERSDPNYIDAATRMAIEIRIEAEHYWEEDEFELAMDKYIEVLQIPNCDKDYRNYANLAGCALQDAITKKTSGQIGGRNSFKIAYEAASKAVEIEPSFEIGWEEMARAYLGYSELPRAKQACKSGLVHFPQSEKLNEIWSVLDEIGVPDEVVDHESQEFKSIYERIYMDRWIGEVGCHYCGLSCMDDPRPEKCPFCGCPDKELDEEQFEMIICLTMYGKKDDSSINGEDNAEGEEEEEDDDDDDLNSDDSEELEMPGLY